MKKRINKIQYDNLSEEEKKKFRIMYLDENFSPGGGEDISFCIEAKNAGYKQVVVPDNNLEFTFTNEGRFPIYHIGEGTLSNKEFPEYSARIVKENGFKNMLKYNKHIKLNLGSGGVEVPGYLNVDLYDQRAHIIRDVTNLDLPENSVEELLVSHNFEHINPYHATEILVKWKNILKPGGRLIMEMPDLEALCKRFVTATKSERYGITNCFYGSVNTSGVGGPDNITSPHLFGYWPDSIKEHLEWAGFINIIFGPEIYPHPESNMHVEAQKPL
jgi:SAM-dependent methyltransferase